MNTNKLDTNLTIGDIHYRFYLDDSQYLYCIGGEDAVDEGPVYSHPVKEYAVDYDVNGKIGAVLLDFEGRFYYYFFNGQSWDAQLLYHSAIDAEMIDFIDIKFSDQTPYIVFCWRDLSAPYLISIVSYFEEADSWKKEIICRTHLKDPCKPYCLTRDHQYNLFLSFLTNNNLIYDLKLSVYRVESSQWDEDIYLASCIYIKYFSVDILPDTNGDLYISWIDKNKNNYCIKYLRLTLENMKKNTGIAIEKKFPITWFFQNIHKNILTIIHCIGEATYFSYALLTQKGRTIWSKKEKPFMLDLQPVFTRIREENIHQSNYSVYSPQAKNSLLDLSELVSHEEAQQFLEEDKMKDANLEPINENILSSRMAHQRSNPTGMLRKHNLSGNNTTDEVSRKQIELAGAEEKNVINSLAAEIRYLKEEVKKLTELNRKYLNLINEGGEKITQYKENIRLLETEKDTLHHKIAVLEKKCTEFERERKKLHTDLQLLQQQKQELNEALAEKDNMIIQSRINENEKDIGFFKKIFK
ncbi:hypothetical protein [Geosporobacter ferrireducens]|uniref:Uncharacterized protein n=1 Tax=Geosporobacter ferrireducens TaxID=1424294 RepID=A0A1D8GPK5_9FIRM|nr:hypothetical protein [Geosporobacter ferrireducens]AOT72845.1 hypothetical protein Gferi_26770 [Geosporobacter ferrireducens]MTI55244.1 hypothetical protein [Geosporobacter ferrireducens]